MPDASRRPEPFRRQTGHARPPCCWYSDRPTGPPLGSIAAAGLWAEPMGVLGYERFGAAGGDIARSSAPTGRR
ncbi:hypothetical protein ACFZCY_40815 [Streptomyces sp. NPDC007983]|uniref:hypothetical protein n=1 Tax=Streptomyces sp. NPDC007983 TaxID=3364800 RepID=UPI0036EA011B